MELVRDLARQYLPLKHLRIPDIRSTWIKLSSASDDGRDRDTTMTATTTTTITSGTDGAWEYAWARRAYGPISSTDLAMKYLPILLILFFFWPVLLTLAVTVVSASSWVFWLVASICVGVVQMLYVAYQFVMIFLDLLILSMLKTFATLRSQVRYYTIKSGLGDRHRKARDRGGSGGKVRRGRRREWRDKLDGARTYRDYLEIEIEELPEIAPADDSGRISAKGPTKVRRIPWRIWRACLRLALGPRAAIKGKRGIGQGWPNDASRAVRKSVSCRNLETMDFRNGNAMSRIKSTENMSRSPLFLAGSDLLVANRADVHLIEQELKMAGEMLLTTTARLREARSQASAASLLRWNEQTNEGVVSMRKRMAARDDEEVREEEVDDGEDHREHHRQQQHEETEAEAEAEAEEEGVESDDGASSLKFLLTGVVKRNHLSVDDLLIEDAQSVAECGRHRYSAASRDVITGYNEEVERCLEWISESPVCAGDAPLPSKGTKRLVASVNGERIGTGPGAESEDEPTALQRQGSELSDRILLLRKLKQNMGRSALMLSGGGAQAMYHLGTIRALIESGLYGGISVISGTSGGSISAAMCALKTPEELYRDVCVSTVSTDFMLDGTMKRENIRWFPRLVDMGAYWLKHKLLVDSAEFKRCCDFYFGDVTFEEAFLRTGKNVCITVTASRAGAGGSAQRLLLNHISTPHVTLASAVACSCALPGVMAPAKLVTKDGGGRQEPFEVDGVEWIDGSVQADLPFKRISTLFNVSNFVVSQTNFHVVPFLRKAHHPGEHSLYWRAFQTCEWDIRSRVLNLSRLGLFPRVFGHDISKVFKQRYHGNLTLVPRFTTMQLFGLKALVNPTVEDMKVYLKNGQIAAWPYISVIKEMLRLETKIEKCITRLEERLDDLVPDRDVLHANNDDVESICSFMSASNRRFLSSHRETELLRQKVSKLERENMQLRRQVERLQLAVGIINSPSQDCAEESPTRGFTSTDDDDECGTATNASTT